MGWGGRKKIKRIYWEKQTRGNLPLVSIRNGFCERWVSIYNSYQPSWVGPGGEPASQAVWAQYSSTSRASAGLSTLSKAAHSSPQEAPWVYHCAEGAWQFLTEDLFQLEKSSCLLPFQILSALRRFRWQKDDRNAKLCSSFINMGVGAVWGQLVDFSLKEWAMKSPDPSGLGALGSRPQVTAIQPLDAPDPHSSAEVFHTVHPDCSVTFSPCCCVYAVMFSLCLLTTGSTSVPFQSLFFPFVPFLNCMVPIFFFLNSYAI